MVSVEAPGEPQETAERQRRLGIIQEYAHLLAGGMRTYPAARAVGVSIATLLAWRNADEELEHIVQEALASTPRGGPRWRAGGEVRHHGGNNTPADRSWHASFLAELERCGNISQAADVAGVGRHQPFLHRDKFPDFAAATKAALRAHAEQVQAEVQRLLDAAAKAKADRTRRGAAAKAERARRARQVDARVGPVWVKLCNRIKSGVPFTQAAEMFDLTSQAVFVYASRAIHRQARLDAALMTGRDPNIAHGSDHSYRKYKCRCPECRVAHDKQR